MALHCLTDTIFALNNENYVRTKLNCDHFINLQFYLYSGLISQIKLLNS